jgi:hypothetical protein
VERPLLARARAWHSVSRPQCRAGAWALVGMRGVANGMHIGSKLRPNDWFTTYCHIQMPIGHESRRIWTKSPYTIFSPPFTQSICVEPQGFRVRNTELSLAKDGSVRGGITEAFLVFWLVQLWSPDDIF